MPFNIIYEDAAASLWQASGVTKEEMLTFLERAIGLMPAPAQHVPYVTVVFSNDARMRELNKRFRSKDRPTNVLSFSDTYDIILAYETIFQECQEQKKRFIDHVRHLLIHGLLHLGGYDHQFPEEAHVMEAIEIKMLAAFNIKNPYL